MKRKIGKHISTTTTILGLLVLTNAVAHAGVSRTQQLNECIRMGIYSYGASAQEAVAACQEILEVPSPRPTPKLDFGRTPYNPPPNLSICEYNLGERLHSVKYSGATAYASSVKREARQEYEECMNTLQK